MFVTGGKVGIFADGWLVVSINSNSMGSSEPFPFQPRTAVLSYGLSSSLRSIPAIKYKSSVTVFLLNAFSVQDTCFIASAWRDAKLGGERRLGKMQMEDLGLEFTTWESGYRLRRRENIKLAKNRFLNSTISKSCLTKSPVDGVELFVNNSCSGTQHLLMLHSRTSEGVCQDSFAAHWLLLLLRPGSKMADTHFRFNNSLKWEKTHGWICCILGIYSFFFLLLIHHKALCWSQGWITISRCNL